MRITFNLLIAVTAGHADPGKFPIKNVHTLKPCPHIESPRWQLAAEVVMQNTRQCVHALTIYHGCGWSQNQKREILS